MEDCRPMSTSMVANWKKLHASKGELADPRLYRRLIGSLMYLVNTRLDLCFAVNTLSQFMVEPRSVHWVVAKHVLRYLSRASKSVPKFFSSKIVPKNLPRKSYYTDQQ